MVKQIAQASFPIMSSAQNMGTCPWAKGNPPNIYSEIIAHFLPNVEEKISKIYKYYFYILTKTFLCILCKDANGKSFRFWSHGDQKRRRFAMKSPCERWQNAGQRQTIILWFIHRLIYVNGPCQTASVWHGSDL